MPNQYYQIVVKEMWGWFWGDLCGKKTPSLGTHLLCSKLLIMLCWLLKNFAYYGQIMLTDIEQFPDNSPTLLVNLHFYR